MRGCLKQAWANYLNGNSIQKLYGIQPISRAFLVTSNQNHQKIPI